MARKPADKVSDAGPKNTIVMHHYIKPWHVMEYDASGKMVREQWVITKHRADATCDEWDPKHKKERKHEVSG